MSIDPQRLGYLAGVLDYSGSMRMKDQRGRKVPIVEIANHDAARMRLFAQTFGGDLHRRSNGIVVFIRTHTKAAAIVRKIRPYLILNTAIADEILQWEPIVRVRQPDKVPCPNDCGNLMQKHSLTCRPCVLDAARAARERKTTEKEAVRVLAKVGGNPWLQLSPEHRVVVPVQVRRVTGVFG